MICIAVPGLGGRAHTSLGIKAEPNYEWSPVDFLSWPGPISVVHGCLLLSIRTLGSPLHNKGFVSFKNYKIFGISAHTSSCNNIFYCLEKEGVNSLEAKVVKAFSDSYCYMWRDILQIPLLKQFFVWSSGFTLCFSFSCPLFHLTLNAVFLLF